MRWVLKWIAMSAIIAKEGDENAQGAEGGAGGCGLLLVEGFHASRWPVHRVGYNRGARKRRPQPLVSLRRNVGTETDS